MHQNVSVIIPTYRSWHKLKICLDALSIQTYPIQNLEIIIVNNDPEERCPFEIHQRNVRLITESKPGSYAARNTGAKNSKYEILAFTDSDCIPSPAWIENGVKELQAGGRSKCILAGVVEIFFSYPNNLTASEVYDSLFAFPHQRSENKKPEAIVTANLFLHKRTLIDCGNFEENLFSGADTLLTEAAKSKNYSIIVTAKCPVLHPATRSFYELKNRRMRIFGGKVMQYICKNKKPKSHALIKSLKKQWQRSKDELIRVKDSNDLSFLLKLKLVVLVFYLYFSTIQESLNIFLTNKYKRE